LLSLVCAVRTTGAQDALRHNSGQPYLTPEETVRQFTVPDGFEVKLFAAEPDLANPIAMCFDERGRLWAIECFEYPKGTPPGQKPKDRIKIFEDTEGDHRADKVTVFAEGFNLATGIAVGHGGVFLGVAPDLLFLRDTDGDDRADTREVLLTGFGRHDTHELLNTFTWGPDGWLYGLHGVFTHSKVRRANSDGAAGAARSPGAPVIESSSPQPNADEPSIEMNAAVWRYHPRTRKFEIFAEGTSNPWGIDFDNRGNMFLTACVIPHLFHMIPGGRYIRQAGQNRNPYDFGQLKEISDHLHHAQSGWAHAGCVVLEGELWPEQLRGSVIFGSIHGNSIKRDVLQRRGSTFLATHAPDFLNSGDKNFRPVHQEIGPDGAIYISDWHDQWPCHQTPPDAWEKERGRVYKIVRKGTRPTPPRDMSKLTDEQLVAELKNPNPYTHRTAQRLLDERRAPVAPLLRRTLYLGSTPVEHSLRALWTLYSVDGFDEAVAETLLAQPEPVVRAWAVRLLGETGKLSPTVRDRLVELAGTDPSPDVRLQLAAACQRLNAPSAVPVLQALAARDEDASDPAIPLMIWLAYEPYVPGRRDRTLQWLAANAKHAIVSRDLLPRVMRRLAATGKPDDLNACLRFAADAKDSPVRQAALGGLATALEGRRASPPEAWPAVSAELARDPNKAVRDATRRVAASFRDPKAIRAAEADAMDSQKTVAERIDAVRAIALAQLPECSRRSTCFSGRTSRRSYVARCCVHSARSTARACRGSCSPAGSRWPIRCAPRPSRCSPAGASGPMSCWAASRPGSSISPTCPHPRPSASPRWARSSSPPSSKKPGAPCVNRRQRRSTS
jgi:putative membrane-bound dehydrogenase-like protein